MTPPKKRKREQRPGIRDGRSKHPLYQTWYQMIYRCDNPASRDYELYGGRGVQVWEYWYDFWVFVEDVGERPAGRTLDRIDNDGDYHPFNVRWSTLAEQFANSSLPGLRRPDGTWKPKVRELPDWLELELERERESYPRYSCSPDPLEVDELGPPPCPPPPGWTPA